MSVWMVMPTAAPIEQAQRCARAWVDAGYRLAIATDKATRRVLPAELVVQHHRYPGYAASVNDLVGQVLACDAKCRVIVAAADDVWPDPGLRAAEIEAQFCEHFGGTMGVMQPSGHADWCEHADRLAWSPWLGRKFCLRANGGCGPLWPEYHHLYVDRELRLMAERLGIFWDRPDLTQCHDTWRKRVPRPPRPAHLEHVAEHTEADALLFAKREATGFPGSELMPC